MSNFTPLVEYKTTFDGDDITLQLSRLKTKDILLVSPYLNAIKDDSGEMTMAFDDQQKFAEVMGTIVPSHVKSMIGLKDKDGNSLDIAGVVEEAYFTEFVSEIMGTLFRISKPEEPEIKKSEAKPAGILKSES